MLVQRPALQTAPFQQTPSRTPGRQGVDQPQTSTDVTNGSGFGSNDPGRERETTNKKPDGFDDIHPISIDLDGELLEPGTKTVAAALKALKVALPYTLRYETERSASGRARRNKPHPDLLESIVDIPQSPQTVRSLMAIIRDALGPEWQATSFVSHVILYKEAREYKYGATI